MSRTINLASLKTRSANDLDNAVSRYENAVASQTDYLLVRWIAKMTAVEIHATWERYVEGRLVAALNHNAHHFLADNNIVGVSRVSSGLASFVVRGGGRFFDFRSMSDLMQKGDRWLGNGGNPFRVLNQATREYIDALASVRNCIVHRSEAAVRTYRRTLRSHYGIHSAPEPDEFLNAIDRRATSPARYQSRLLGLARVISQAIQNT